VRRAGLPVALGGVGISLEELTRLYAALANGGEARAPRLTEQRQAGERAEGAVMLSPKAAWYLTDILRGSPRPAGFLPEKERLAFKTGTSYGFRDAWALGYDGGHTAGVWIGRPDGGYTPGLSGLHAAVPVLLELFDLLPTTGLTPLLRQRPEEVLLVGNSELPPALRRFGDLVPAHGAPVHGRHPVRIKGPRILFPPQESLVELEEGNGALQLQASGGEMPLHWLVNGRFLSTRSGSRSLQWTPEHSGATRLTVVDGRGRSDSVDFRVRRAGEGRREQPLTE